ncbi:MAG: phage shock protein operon transcriptional activator [Deltaproteobacteria bacterium]|nr:phage shock protein operon transcriptional activator [Deltaproteobacteria bacterium]
MKGPRSFSLRRVTAEAASTREALGQSELFLTFQEQISRVAPVERPVILIGERGTGKELAATRLHYLSRRWEEPLVALNCAALSPTLIESELFGYEKGAFTGAEKRRKGRFEAADGGTLFLDEIGNIPLQVQEKILRVVEYGSFERVGSSEAVEVDVRIIAATNADLQGMAAKGQFKQDLLDRLSFEVLFLPPLRDRRGDVLLLGHHFASRMAMELGREEVPAFSEEAMAALEAYLWPGNIRELKNVVERAVYRSKKALIREIDFDPFQALQGKDLQPGKATSARAVDTAAPGMDLPGKPFEKAVEGLKISLLKRALGSAKYNQQKAAEDLGLTYHQFRGLYRKYRKRMEEILPEGRPPATVKDELGH